MKGGAKRAFVLGPTCDPELSAVGISTIEQVRAIGWEEAAARWIEGFPARANVNAVVGLMALDLGVNFRDLSPKDRERARGFVARHKGLFQTLPSQRNETQAPRGDRLKAGRWPVETDQRRGATRIGSAATGGVETTSKLPSARKAPRL